MNLAVSQTDLIDFQSALNPEQAEAVAHTDGPLLVFAGAGSGKTRVLTHRFAHLVCSYGVLPQEILCVTFTNKAASEMKQRIFALLQKERRSSQTQNTLYAPWVGTFHSCCARLLRRHAESLEYTPNFAIYDTNDSLSLIKRIVKQLRISSSDLTPKGLLGLIDRAKNGYQFPEDIKNWSSLPTNTIDILYQVYSSYQRELLKANAMDFGDLISNSVTLLTLEKEIRAFYQKRFRYIMVDEFQDTNKVQYRLLKLLATQHQNICAVGDDDQSIYAFRGATIDNILNFHKDFPHAKSITLSRNYRSTANILTAANRIIEKNKKRQKKEMITENPPGDSIVGFGAADAHDEAEFVAREIIAQIQTGVSMSEIAVFYRTNALSRSIEEALCRHNIPYAIYGTVRFYERQEIKDLLAYFRLALNQADNEALLRVINVPSRGLGAKTVAGLVEWSRSRNLNIFAGAKQALSEGRSGNVAFLTTGAAKKLSSFVDLIDELAREAQKTQTTLDDNEIASGNKHDLLANLFRTIADRSEYLPRLRADQSEESNARIENIQELFRVAGEFLRTGLSGLLNEGASEVQYGSDSSGGEGSQQSIGQESGGISLVDFLQRTALASDLDQNAPQLQGNTTDKKTKQTKTTDTVSLMTLHLAKGLEFDVVFFIGLEEGLVPHSRSFFSSEDLEEERRLCYVGVTRARKKLFLSHCSYRDSSNAWRNYDGEPSRFLQSIPFELVDDRNGDFF